MKPNSKREDRNPFVFDHDLPPPTKAEMKFIRSIDRKFFKEHGLSAGGIVTRICKKGKSLPSA